MRTVILIAPLLLVILTMSACGSKDDKKSTSAKTVLPAGLVTQSIPGSPQTVIETIKDKKVGDEALVVGRIGGRYEPFAKDRAVFQLIDSSLKSCDELGDGCTVPWDYCCEPQDHISASSMAIQVVGSDGRPLPVGLEGKDGLEPLATLVILGKVQHAGDGSFVVDASKIMIAKASPVPGSHSDHDHE